MEIHRKSRKQLEAEVKYGDAQIAYMQEHDLLTGFVNFSLTGERIDQLIQHYPNRPLAILLLGMDNFRLLNDTMSSFVGDVLLRKISRRIIEQVQASDLLSRKGGDEFIIVMHHESVAETTRKARIILKAITQPFMINEQQVYITASLGISLYPQDAQYAEELLTYANIALDHVKDIGKNYYRYYTKPLGKKAFYRQWLQNDLFQALARDDFFIHYQPKIDIRDMGSSELIRLCFCKSPCFHAS